MANHRYDIHEVEDGFETGFKAACLCRATSNTQMHRWQAEDWGRDHLALVERVKAQLAPRTVSLARQRDYFREMSNKPDVPEGERRLWAALADELDHRLNDQGPADDGQEALFSLETERQKP